MHPLYVAPSLSAAERSPLFFACIPMLSIPGHEVICGFVPALLCLQASAADNGQCLVHDVTAFNSNGIVDGMVNCVAAANISEAQKQPDCIKALVWHGAELLLVGTEQGENRTALEHPWLSQFVKS